LANKKLITWVEQYLFFPTPFMQLISILVLPLTLLYCLIIAFKRSIAKPKYFGIPVISIGNILVGGTGKTPITIALAKDFENVAVVLRGYARESKNLIVVSKNGKLLCDDVRQTGDEAMLLANSLLKATIIVSKDRKEAIIKAKELGSKIVFLDDGFSKYDIVKYDILVRPKDEPKNIFCLPSGGYREPKIMYGIANQVLVENKDFKRVIKIKKDNKIIENIPSNFVVITAISKANRLLEYLPKDTILEAFEDHYFFTQEDIDNIIKKYPNHNFITTAKDMVKLKKYNIKDLYLIDLEIKFSENLDLSNLNKLKI
jgi:tetraacyldisaccharide 4'-kinase